MPVAVKRYVLSQFVVAIGLTLTVFVLYANEGAQAVLVPCVLLWALLYTLGLLDEMRSYAFQFEAVRLLVIVPLGTWALGSHASWLVLAASAYIVVSLIGLLYTIRNLN